MVSGLNDAMQKKRSQETTLKNQVQSGDDDFRLFY